MSDFCNDLINDLRVAENQENRNIIATAFEKEYKLSKIREVFRDLQENHCSCKGYTLTKEETMKVLNVAHKVLEDMMKNGTSPSFYRTSDKKQAPIRFHMISVAEFLVGVK